MPKLSVTKKQVIDTEIKDKVYKEALTLLKENDAQLFTMAELADRVGIAKGTLYNYFADKSTVILYLNDRMTKEVFMDLRKELANMTDYKECLRLAFRTFRRTMAEHYFLHVATLIISNEQLNIEWPKRLSDAPVNTIMPYMEDMFRKGIAAGVFKDMPVEYLSGFMAATLHGLSAIFSMPQHNKKDYAKRSAAMEELLVSALCR